MNYVESREDVGGENLHEYSYHRIIMVEFI